jgi:hypothetical protein
MYAILATLYLGTMTPQATLPGIFNTAAECAAAIPAVAKNLEQLLPPHRLECVPTIAADDEEILAATWQHHPRH